MPSRGSIPRTSTDPVSVIASVTAPVGVENVAGAQVNPATQDTLALQYAALGAAADAVVAAGAAGTHSAKLRRLTTDLGALLVLFAVVATATNTKISVGSSDTTILAANASRKFAVIVNDSDETIYLSLSATAVQGEGIRLNAAGGAYEINAMNRYTGEISGICTSGGKYVTVSEG